MPPALAALLDGAAPVLLERVGAVGGVHPSRQARRRQEDALVDHQLAQPVPDGGRSFGGAVRGRHPQRLQQGHDPAQDPGVVERLGGGPLAGPEFHGEVPGAVGRTRAAERVLLRVHDERGVLFQPDALLEPPEALARTAFGRVGREVGEALPGQLLGHQPGELPPLEPDQARDDGEEEERHPGGPRAGPVGKAVAEPVGAGGPGAVGVVRGGAAGVAVRFGIVLEQTEKRAAEHQEPDEDQRDPPVPAHQEGEHPPVDRGFGRRAPDPGCEGQQHTGEEHGRDDAPGEGGAEQPGRQDARGPPQLGAAGAQGVGEDPGGVEARRRGHEALLLDVQLLDHRVPVAVVQMDPGAQQPARLARGGVHGRLPEQIVLALRRPWHGAVGHRLLIPLKIERGQCK
ncbi:hypothetical protein [Streptomyces globisporus]|uniref:hypothetical protein n=1 Tax=Streptomyces globisporus TaxID=1908 RepID=UPI0030B87F4C